MVQDLGDGSTPVAGTVSPEERNDANADLAGSQAAAQVFSKADKVVSADKQGLVAYVAAEEYANQTWLVKAGEPQYLKQEGATSPGMRTREGDIKAKFTNSVLVTDIPEIIEWCEAHPSICRRETDPMTKGWVTLKSLQARRANRERLIDPTEMDADKSFPRDSESNLREQVASPDSVGGKAVESARISRESIQQEQAAGN